MPEFSVAVLADQAIIDRHGKLSLIGIFRNVTLRKVPAVYPKFTVAAIISQIDKPIKVSIEVVDLKENSTIVKLPPAEVKAPHLGDDVQIVLDLAQVPFRTFGKHEVRIMFDGQVKKFIPFNVREAMATAKARPLD